LSTLPAPASHAITWEKAYQAGRRRWPLMNLSRADFLPLISDAAAAPDLETAESGDVFLAFACAAGIPAALAEFDALYLAGLGGRLGRFDLSPDELDEVRQRLRVRFFLGDRPRIRDYQGRGPLGGWVRMAAIRTVLNMKAQGGPVSCDGGDRSDEAAATGATPELAALVGQFGGRFRAAMEEAIRALPARDRTLLQMHFIEGLSLAELGAVYRVHRATIARWLVDCRTRVIEVVRSRLPIRAPASPSELRSLVAAIGDQVDLSVTRVFREASEGGTAE
jgi:RNA polymerase sigma-70 factor, ECF subfamily